MFPSFMTNTHFDGNANSLPLGGRAGERVCTTTKKSVRYFGKLNSYLNSCKN